MASESRERRTLEGGQDMQDDSGHAKPAQDYVNFINAKSHLSGTYGFEPTFVHPMAYDFQSHLTEWACLQGRGAIFADCGLGKTLMQLTWAHNVVRHTGKPVLILSPLSVALQTVDEAAKFDLECKRSLDGSIKSEIVTANYERLAHFNPDDFSGVVCDESSILKNFDGARKSAITEFMKKVEYRLLCTATAAPNDYIELGTSAEALGHMGHMDMLGMFFKNDEDSIHPAFAGSKWRFKRHAERDFWRWVCSWARACRKPSDIGFADGDFVLPPMVEREHVVQSPPLEGHLFPVKATSLAEQREERKATIEARCEKAAEMLDHDDFGVAWCHLNAEADLLERLIPGAVQISGADDDERKEEVIEGFRKGHIKKLVTKPKIAAFGMNWQHCAHMTYFPDHSFEQFYQASRRFWRFGQKRTVRIDNIISESNAGVSANLRRKAEACEQMFASLVAQMNDALNIRNYRPHTGEMELPSWL
ncbi:MAG TPA: hypothetical protein PKI99_01990 [Terrimesophilobacter sp.]|nr:hypothetical protein [Terrimesophilobacter sp.]